MLKRTCIFLHPDQLKALADIAKAKGSKCPSALVRVAIAEFIKREARKA